MYSILLLLLLTGVAWGQATTAPCGPHSAGCGPAGVHSTTTLPATPPPSWVPGMLAAWMLDEATGTRVNLQGNTILDLVPTGVVANDPVNKMEGAAAAYFAAGMLRSGSITLPTAALTFGCWLRPTSGTFAVMEFYHSGGTGGIYFNSSVAGTTDFMVTDGINFAGLLTATTPFNTYTHMVGTVGTNTVQRLYVNGVLVGTQPSTAGLVPTDARTVGLSQSSNWLGQMDECFFSAFQLATPSICRICSCGIRGEQCLCAGTAYVNRGRNATQCNACTLPVDCTQASA